MSENNNNIDQELIPLEEEARSLQIKDKKSMSIAVIILTRLNQVNDQITEEKEKVTKPLNEALAAERKRWKPTEIRNQILIDEIRAKMTDYQTNLVNTVKEAEEKITSRIGEGRGKLKIETAIAQLGSLPKVEKVTSTEEGSVQFREKAQVKITDTTLIPEEYWRIDADSILEDLKKGFVIPGAELEIIQIPYNIR